MARCEQTRSLWQILKGTTDNWLEDQASSISAALAFYCAFSLAPLLIIIVSIAGWIVGGELAYSYVGSQLTMLFGKQSATLILEAMRSAQTTEGTWATIVSVVMLLVGASTVFAALESALQQVWGGRDSLPRGWRSFVRSRLISFGFILAIGFLLLVSLTLTTALAALRGYVLRHFEGLVGILASTGLRAVDRARHRPGRAHVPLSTGAAPGLAARDHRRAGDGAAVPSRTLGDRPVPGSRDAADGLWRRGIVRRAAAVAVLLGADLPVRRGVHGLSRAVAHAEAAGAAGADYCALDGELAEGDAEVPAAAGAGQRQRDFALGHRLRAGGFHRARARFGVGVFAEDLLDVLHVREFALCRSRCWTCRRSGRRRVPRASRSPSDRCCR